MKPPMYGLLISPDSESRSKIVSGHITVTVREGHRDYQKGPVLLACHLVPWAVRAVIVNVRHCMLEDVTDDELQCAGVASREGLRESLRIYYPEMAPASPVTVIRWDDVQGFFKDCHKVFAQNPVRVYQMLAGAVRDAEAKRRMPGGSANPP